MAQLLESILNQILQAQATEQLEADYYERTDTRKGYRNGTYPHTLSTRVGSLTLKVPRLRNGDFSTDLFARLGVYTDPRCPKATEITCPPIA